MVSQAERIRQRINRAVWRLFNPVARRLAGIAPWWVVLETTGRRSGRPRRVPLARGPIEGRVAWLIAVHGERAGFARNIAADQRVRLQVSGRWHRGHATLVPVDESVLTRFSAYARGGPAIFGIEPRLVRIELAS